MEPIEGVTFLNGDFREPEVQKDWSRRWLGAWWMVVSDMAPNLSGIESADAARIAHLVELAVDFARAHLKPDGALGGEAVSWQWVQRSGELVQADLQGGEALEAESIAG